LKGAGKDVAAFRFFLGKGGDSKLIGRNSFRSVVGLAPALLGVHTTGGASSTSFFSELFLTLESSVDDFTAGDQTPVQQKFVFNINFRVLYPAACVCKLVYEGVCTIVAKMGTLIHQK
jgi:hypothetical protein